SRRTYKTVCDGIAFGRTSVLVDAVDVARSEKKWIFLLRCGACGAMWAEACWSSGHMDLYYIFPVPPGEDPIVWLNDRAHELTWDQRGPIADAPAPEQ
ncbi:MAG TPA: hypothetical protein VGL53_00400, partial [Bryobacteraceae bacterium]